MLVRIGLWLVAAVDVLALVYLLVVLAPGADVFHFAVWRWRPWARASPVAGQG